MNETTTITTATGSTYIIVNGEDITRVSNHAMEDHDGYSLARKIECADWEALRTPEVGDRLLGLADGIRLCTARITTITVELAS